MALSGSYSKLYSNFGVVCNWTGVQSQQANQTTITTDVYLKFVRIQVGSRTGTYQVGAATGNWSARSIDDLSSSSVHTVKLGSFTEVVQHDVQGYANGITLKTVYPAKLTYSGTYYSSITASAVVDLDQIPQVAVINLSLADKTETTAQVNWSTDAVVDALWRSTNGTTWTSVSITEGNSGTYNFTGLTANTEYNLWIRVRRKDTQLTSETSIPVTTYSYPYATVMPDFLIGDSVTIQIFNPLGRSTSVQMTDAGGTNLGTNTTSTTSFTGWNSSTVVTRMYNSIPNATSGTYKVVCTYSGHSVTKTGGTYTINPSSASPGFTSVAYRDTNATAVAMTGDDQDIIQNQSLVRYTARPTASTGASVSAVQVAVNGQTYALTQSGNDYVGGNATINSAYDVTATFTVTDSRGLTYSQSVNVNMLSWSVPSAIITAQRQSNYYTETDVNVDADYSYINGNNTITITYAATKQGDSSPTVSGSLQDNVTSTINLDNDYSWTMVITLVDGLGGTTTYTIHISRGMPIIFFDRLHSSVGVDCFPTSDQSLETGGLSLLSDNRRTVGAYSSASVTLPSESGRVLRLTYNGAITLTVPDDLPIGYEVYLIASYSSARITMVSPSGGFYVAGITSVQSSYTIPLAYSLVHIIKVNTNRWAFFDGVSPYYTKGDTISGSNIRAAWGFINSAQKDMHLYVPLAKPLAGVSGATLNSMSGSVFASPNGLVQYYDGTTYTAISSRTIPYDSVTINRYTDMLDVVFTCTNKWGRGSAPIDGNTPITALITGLSITLT